MRRLLFRYRFRYRAMLGRLFDRGASDNGLAEETRSFADHEAESKIRSGKTPEDARRAALVELGGAGRFWRGRRRWSVS
jgi:hypothetical protein